MLDFQIQLQVRHDEVGPSLRSIGAIRRWSVLIGLSLGLIKEDDPFMFFFLCFAISIAGLIDLASLH